ncbi:hypothetical protein CANCADRAFT_32649 [Tortispora caseinolytica NRRL Y-17796]|uniref:Nucleoside transporter n=1 Tax=Tortispora caseinolytica NRRL Y-17796 TaxID=767744 RepID=A0A1E4TC79_9ASCO|nr:hypothetical protein CANCADRAFT_32649 [Tortispora caseinolytica NRRL Y-17796]
MGAPNARITSETVPILGSNAHQRAQSYVSIEGDPSGTWRLELADVPSDIDSEVVDFDEISTEDYIAFIILGLAMLWPFNTFLSASAYFNQRFQDVPALHRAHTSTIMSILTVVQTIMQFVFLKYTDGADYGRRIRISIYLNLTVFSLLALSVLLWPIHQAPVAYFVFLISVTFLSAFGNSFAQNGTMALAALFGARSSQGTMVGQGIAGVLPPLVQVIPFIRLGLRTTAGKHETATAEQFHFQVSASSTIYIVFFVSAIVAGLVNLGTLDRLLKRKRFILDGIENDNGFSGVPMPLDDGSDSESPKRRHIHIGSVAKKIPTLMSCLFLCFILALIYPPIAARTYSVSNPPFRDDVFIPFAIFIWNFGDFLGRVICAYDFITINNEALLVVYTVFRPLFVIFLVGGNIDGKGAHWLRSDLIYMTTHFLYGLTNGHMSSSCIISTTKKIQGQEREVSGSLIGLVICTALSVGSVLSFIISFLL